MANCVKPHCLPLPLCWLFCVVSCYIFWGYVWYTNCSCNNNWFDVFVQMTIHSANQPSNLKWNRERISKRTMWPQKLTMFSVRFCVSYDICTIVDLEWLQFRLCGSFKVRTIQIDEAGICKCGLLPESNKFADVIRTGSPWFCAT